jgi:hypothetical protein
MTETVDAPRKKLVDRMRTRLEHGYWPRVRCILIVTVSQTRGRLLDVADLPPHDRLRHRRHPLRRRGRLRVQPHRARSALDRRRVGAPAAKMSA